MKKVKYLAMLLVAGMFAACSDNLEDTGAGNAGGTTPATGEGYVKVAINMPTTSGGMSRADDDGTDTGNNDVIFDDGKSDEYNITGGIIAFFAGTAENTAKFKKAYDLGDLSFSNQNPADDQVSSRVATITEAPVVPTGTKLYALVILNPNQVVTIKDSQTEGDLIVGGTLLSSTSTLSDLQDNLNLATTVDACTKINGTGTQTSFLMTNAPLTSTNGDNVSTTEGTAITAQTLVPVKVYATRELANDANAAPDEIYVERIVAKVTLKGFDSNKQIIVDNTNSAYDDDVVTLEGWTLNVTNNYTYLVRKVSELSTWAKYTDNDKAIGDRFIGNTAVNSNATTKQYRIYWAEDPNYSSLIAGKTNFTIYKESDTNIPWIENCESKESIGADNYPAYCLENTFNTDNQNRNKTTTLLLKAKYDMTGTGDQSFFVVGNIAQAYTETDFLNYVKTKVSGLSEATLTIKPDAAGGFYNKEGGTKKLSDIILNNGSAIEGDNATALNNLGQVNYYKDGVSYYYSVLIKHFGDGETPYVAGESYTEAKHLGRYGVVRNNWYEINITGISGPGLPEIEDPDPDPDDGTEGFVKCAINVLSWARRTQNVEL